MHISKKILAVAAGSALALTMASCGGGDAGSTAGDTITIGIKYDQPGLGQKVGEDYKGHGRRRGALCRQGTWLRGRQADLQGDSVGAAGDCDSGRSSRVDLRDLFDYRRAQEEGVLRWSVLHCRSGSARSADNTDITGPEAMNGKTLCSVTGSTPAEKIKKEYATTVKLFEQDTYSKCVEALVGGTVDAVTTDNVILAGFAAQPQYAGKLKVVGKPFSTERYGVGLKLGDTELCNKVNAALEKMISDGSWQKAVDDNVGPSGFKVDTTTNPPKPDACAAV